MKMVKICAVWESAKKRFCFQQSGNKWRCGVEGFDFGVFCADFRLAFGKNRARSVTFCNEPFGFKRKKLFRPRIVDIKAGLLTEAGQLESIGRADQIYESLQLEATSCNIQIVIEHRKFEGWLHFVGALLENCAWNGTKIFDSWLKAAGLENCRLTSSIKFNEFSENEVNKPLNDFSF